MNVDLSSDVQTKENTNAWSSPKRASHLLQYLLLTAGGLVRNVCIVNYFLAYIGSPCGEMRRPLESADVLPKSRPA